MNSAIPLSTQRKCAQRFESSSHCLQDVWEYALDGRWLQQWRVALWGDKEPLKDHGPIPMDENHCVYVGSTLWALLMSWFGVSPQHSLRRRHVSNMYFSVRTIRADTSIMSDNNSDFLEISVCNLKDLNSPMQRKVMVVYGWESLEYLEMQVKRLLSLSYLHHSKVWYMLNKAEKSFASDTFCDKQQSLMASLCTMYPSLGDILLERQSHITNEKAYPSTPFSQVKQPLVSVLYNCEQTSIVIAVEEVSSVWPQFTLAGIQIPPYMPAAMPRESSLSDVIESLTSSARSDWEKEFSATLKMFFNDQNRNTASSSKELLEQARSVVREKTEQMRKYTEECTRKQKELSRKEQELNMFATSLTEREAQLSERVDKFKKGVVDFQLRKQKLEDELKKIEDVNKISGSQVVLNVGGQHFTTSLTTLTSEESMFSVMFSGRHPVKKESDGSYFVDRDGTNFRHILNYLRDGERTVETLAQNLVLMKEILIEAEYYNIQGLVALVQKKLKRASYHDSGTFSLS